eukprot:397694-Pelagomonas_calceolata.AAC.2
MFKLRCQKGKRDTDLPAGFSRRTACAQTDWTEQLANAGEITASITFLNVNDFSHWAPFAVAASANLMLLFSPMPLLPA